MYVCIYIYIYICDLQSIYLYKYKYKYICINIYTKDVSEEGECRKVMQNMVCSFCLVITN